MTESDNGGGKVDPPDPPVDPDVYHIHVKMPPDADDDPVAVQGFLTRIADELNASDTTTISGHTTHPVRTDGDGDTWAKGTMVIPMYLGCGTKKPDDGEGDDGVDGVDG